MPELRKNLDEVFSKWIRKRDTGPDGFITCFICGKKVRPKEAVNAHFILRHNTALRWDEVNCHATCFECNNRDVTDPKPYYNKMIETYGLEIVESLSFKGKGMVKYMACEIEELIQKYKI